MIDGRLTKTRISPTIRRRYKLCLLGSLVAAIISSSCCLGPVIFSTFGIVSPSLIRLLASRRPIFLGLSILALGAAFVDYRLDSKDAACLRAKRTALLVTLVFDCAFIFSSNMIDLFL
jgi:hypothetical protein